MAAVNQICSERGIEPEAVLDTLSHALIAAYRKDYGDVKDIEVKINKETGEVTLLKEGKDVTPAGFGRIAAQTAKQVILQGVKEAEKTAIFEELEQKIGAVVSGMLQRQEGHSWIVSLGRATAVFPPQEQVLGEEYRHNQRLKFFLKEIREIKNKKTIIISRQTPELIEGLFKLEVPEVSLGTVEIKAIAREPGLRSKIAVVSNQEGVDPVGSCVGQRGIRVQAVTNELGGEKLDIILWDEDSAKFVVAALSPAEVSEVTVDKKRKKAKVKVPADQLSLAIGKGGQNVRLAAKLTGYKIDIRSEEEDLEKLSLPTRVENLLRKEGITLEKLKKMTEEELLEIKGIGPKAVEEIRNSLHRSSTTDSHRF